MAFSPHGRPAHAAVIGPWAHSHKALMASRYSVLAVPTVDLAETVVDVGNCSVAEIDEFEAFGLTPLPAVEVGAPLVAECLANIECRVSDASLAERHDLVFLEPVAIHLDGHRAERRILHHRGAATFAVEGEVLDLRDRMVLWKGFQKEL